MENRDNLFSIGEVARSVNVTRRIIINYEQHGLITPDLKEGTLGNRYYTADSLTRIRTIRVFQNMGLSLDEIYSYLNDATELEPLIKRLETLRDELNMNINKLRARSSRQNSLNVERVVFPAQFIYRKMICSTTLEERTAFLRNVFLEATKQYGSDISRYMLFIEYTIAEPEKVYYCVSVPEGSTGEYVYQLPQMHALRTTWHGGYEGLPAVRDRLVRWAAKEGVALSGVCRHVYLEGPPQHQDKAKFITQVVLPICDKA